MNQVTLQQVLQAREDRVRMQHQFLELHQCPLICFTMNIAGPVKFSPLILRGFQAGLEALEHALPRKTILACQINREVTGCQAIYSVAMEAEALKKLCTAIEDASPLGRLFDMDVIGTDGKKLERPNLRGCMVCGKPDRSCAAGRLHPVSQLQTVTTQILTEHFSQSDRLTVADMAVESLLEEVNTTPKPGLVDRRNRGSHTDMNIHTFTASAQALRPYFEECVRIGQQTAAQMPDITFSLLRQAGLEAEKAMYRVTSGVNTHKGAIFTLGILCGSLGRLWTPEVPFAPTNAILSQCAQIGQSALRDFAPSGDTAGQQLYRTHGISGIRGEVASGLLSVANIALPVYTEALSRGLSPNDAAAITLVHLIARVEDTNLYHRGGPEGAAFAKSAARRLLQETPWPTPAQLESLDDAFITKNLSPGGCADLLAATCFLHRIAQQSNIQ